MKSIAKFLSGIGLPILLPLSLAACGGGGGGTAQDPLVPKLVFSSPEAGHSGAGTAEVKLEVVNNTTSNISNIQVEITFPANVAIEGGSVGGLCNQVAGDSTPSGYKFTLVSLGAGQECGVFMDIYPTDGPGNKTFSAAVGSITGNSVPPNAQTYSWTWDGTGDGSGTSSGGSSGGSGSSSGSGGTSVDGTGIYSGTLTDSQNGGTTYGIYGLIPKGQDAIFAIYSGTDVVASSAGGLVAQSNGPMQFAADGSFVKLFTNEVANVYTGATYDGSENVTGKVAPRNMISGSYTSDSGRLLNGSFSAAYDAAHSEMPAALASVAGTYSFSISINHTGGARTYIGTLTVSGAGAITGTSNGIGGSAGSPTCSYSGTMSVPDAARNIYFVSLTQDCGVAGQVADLSGDGLAMLEGQGGNLRLLFEGLTDGAVAELVRQ